MLKYSYYENIDTGDMYDMVLFEIRY